MSRYSEYRDERDRDERSRYDQPRRRVSRLRTESIRRRPESRNERLPLREDRRPNRFRHDSGDAKIDMLLRRVRRLENANRAERNGSTSEENQKVFTVSAECVRIPTEGETESIMLQKGEKIRIISQIDEKNK